MNLFRSEVHVRSWSGFRQGTEEGILRLPVLARLFSASVFTRRADADYVSHLKEYRDGFIAALSEIAKSRPFWSPHAP
jgi:hypothetical protein